jgi:hypothetical protein
MPRHVEVAAQLDLPLASVATKAAEAAGSASGFSTSSPTDQLPLFACTAATSVPTQPRAGRAFTTFRKLGELLRRQTKTTTDETPRRHSATESHATTKGATPT